MPRPPPRAAKEAKVRPEWLMRRTGLGRCARRYSLVRYTSVTPLAGLSLSHNSARRQTQRRHPRRSN